MFLINVDPKQGRSYEIWIRWPATNLGPFFGPLLSPSGIYKNFRDSLQYNMFKLFESMTLFYFHLLLVSKTNSAVLQDILINF